MAMQKKSLIDSGPAKQKAAGGGSGTQPSPPAKSKKLAVAKLVTAKLSTAKLTTLRKFN